MWLQHRFSSLHQQGWNLFSKEISYGESVCTLFGFVDQLQNKKNMVLIHGLGSSWNFWAKSVEEFSTEYNVFIYDMPWNCSHPCPFFTLGQLTDWLLSVIKISEIPKPILLAHSYGSLVLLNMIGKSEVKMIDKLILCSTPLSGNSEKDRSLRINTLQANYKKLVYDSVMAFIRPETEPDTIIHMCNMVLETVDQKTMYNYIDLAFQETQPLPEKVDIPTLLIIGENDYVTPKEDSIWINKKLQGSQYFCISKAKHLPMAEAKEEFYECVRRFCAE